MRDPCGNATDRRLFEIGYSWSDRRYDAGRRLVGGSRGSAAYALFLAASGQAHELDRVRQIIPAVIEHQERNAASPNYGLFRTGPHTPDYTDQNWAAFCASYLMHLPAAYGDRLDEATRTAIGEAVERACVFIRRRNVTPRYTNIALLSASVVTVGGELFGLPEFLEEGRRKLREFRDTLNLTGGFNEYTSPTYYGTNLSALCWMEMFVKDDEIHDLALRIEHRLWRTIAAHYHAPTQQVAGPYSRAYGNILQHYSAAAKYYVGKVLEGAFENGDDEEHGGDTTYAGLAALQRVCCPDDAKSQMLAPPSSKTIVEVVGADRFVDKDYAGPFVQMTTRLEPRFALGTVNVGEGWVQRRNLMLHFLDRRDRTAALWTQVREDDETVRGRDNEMWCVQADGRALVLHDFSRMAAKPLSALSVAFVVETEETAEVWVNGVRSANPAADLTGSDILLLRFGPQAIGLKLFVENVDGQPATVKVLPGDGELGIGIDLYRGERRELSGAAFQQTRCTYGFATATVPSDEAFSRFLRDFGGELTASGRISAAWRAGSTRLEIVAAANPEGVSRYETRVDGRRVRAARLFADVV